MNRVVTRARRVKQFGQSLGGVRAQNHHTRYDAAGWLGGFVILTCVFA